MEHQRAMSFCIQQLLTFKKWIKFTEPNAHQMPAYVCTLTCQHPKFLWHNNQNIISIKICLASNQFVKNQSTEPQRSVHQYTFYSQHTRSSPLNALGVFSRNRKTWTQPKQHQICQIRSRVIL